MFHHRHVILPVIHVSTLDQAMRNTQTARDAAADGVFLINHSILSRKLLEIHEQVHASFPDWWTGVNCLGMHPADVFRHVSGNVRGIWVDNALIAEYREEQLEAETVLDARGKSGWNGLYFGGVAFKYQGPVFDLPSAARLATRYMDVVTTSGPGTGYAADVAKIQTMKEAIGGFPLAIASGITPENVTDYLPYADCFLVATGISRDFENLDPGRTRALVARVRDWESAVRQ